MKIRNLMIGPRLGPLSWVNGSVVHQRGYVSADLRMEGGRIRDRSRLPEVATGKLVRDSRETGLRAWKQV